MFSDKRAITSYVTGYSTYSLETNFKITFGLSKAFFLPQDENIEATKELSNEFYRVLHKKFINWRTFDSTIFNNQTNELNLEELADLNTKALNTNKINLNNSIYSCEECSLIVLMVLSVLEYSFYLDKIEEFKQSIIKIENSIERQKERIKYLTNKSSYIIQKELNYDIMNKLVKNSNLSSDKFNFHVNYFNHVTILH